MVSGPRTRPRAEFGLRFGTESLLRFTTPRLTCPRIRDLQYLITYGSSFFHDEQHHLRTHTECPWPNVLAYRVINSDPEDRYQIRKEIITDPHMSCVLQHRKLDGDAQFLSRLRLYVLCALHLGLEGGGTTALVDGRRFEIPERIAVVKDEISCSDLRTEAPISGESCPSISRNWQPPASLGPDESPSTCSCECGRKLGTSM